MTRQVKEKPAKVPMVAVWLTKELWQTLISFLTSQIDHVQSNVLKGRVHHRIVRHLNNQELIQRLQAIENQLRTQFYNPRREKHE